MKKEDLKALIAKLSATPKKTNDITKCTPTFSPGELWGFDDFYDLLILNKNEDVCDVCPVCFLFEKAGPYDLITPQKIFGSEMVVIFECEFSIPIQNLQMYYGTLSKDSLNYIQRAQKLSGTRDPEFLWGLPYLDEMDVRYCWHEQLSEKINAFQSIAFSELFETEVASEYSSMNNIIDFLSEKLKILTNPKNINNILLPQHAAADDGNDNFCRIIAIDSLKDIENTIKCYQGEFSSGNIKSIKITNDTESQKIYIDCEEWIEEDCPVFVWSISNQRFIADGYTYIKGIRINYTQSSELNFSIEHISDLIVIIYRGE